MKNIEARGGWGGQGLKLKVARAGWPGQSSPVHGERRRRVVFPPWKRQHESPGKPQGPTEPACEGVGRAPRTSRTCTGDCAEGCGCRLSHPFPPFRAQTLPRTDISATLHRKLGTRRGGLPRACLPERLAAENLLPGLTLLCRPFPSPAPQRPAPRVLRGFVD